MLKILQDNIKIFSLLLLILQIAACATSPQHVSVSSDEIEIYEEYGVDPKISADFDQAVKHISAERYEEAITLLLRVTENTKKHSAPYINLSLAYSKTGKIEEAENALMSALKINPAHPVTLNEIGMVYRKTGRFSEAKKSYESVLGRYPQFLPARKNIGILCDIFMNDLPCAIAHYEAYLQLKPTDEGVKIWLADLKNRAGK